MPAGLLFVRFCYPDMLHVNLPSVYLLSARGRRACVRVEAHYPTLQLTDLTNYMAPMENNANKFRPHQDINSEYKNGRHYSVGILSQADYDKGVEEFKRGNPANPRVLHNVTFDSEPDGRYRAFRTRFATVLAASYEIENVEEIEASDISFYASVVNQFVHIYRIVSKDHRPRLIEDIQEPMAIDYGVIAYEDAELERPIDDRIGASREVMLDKKQDKWVYDRQPFSDTPANEITSKILEFTRAVGTVTEADEFLSMAKHAAFLVKNFGIIRLTNHTAMPRLLTLGHGAGNEQSRRTEQAD